ncbi:MAG: hypothetical protein RRC34_08025 [Lentisphaeria bacterium]|nr:hypothetical protein [Lentisphaeria bacterium]
MYHLRRIFYATLLYGLTAIVAGTATIGIADDVTLKPVPAPPIEPMPEDSFYEKPSIFSMRLDDTAKFMHPISRFGPVGIGIDLHPPSFVMKVGGTEYLFIEEGGFDEKYGPDWKCPWIVFKRSK